jgi:DNA-binding PadR family transcriptional regulator
MAGSTFGRFAEPALWILVTLRRGPAAPVALLDAVRALDGPVGPATLLGALARLERSALVERVVHGGRAMYRLTTHSGQGAV